jgi:hypothetical protein
MCYLGLFGRLPIYSNFRGESFFVEMTPPPPTPPNQPNKRLENHNFWRNISTENGGEDSIKNIEDNRECINKKFDF